MSDINEFSKFLMSFKDSYNENANLSSSEKIKSKELAIDEEKDKYSDLKKKNRYQNITYRRYLIIWTCLIVTFYLIIVAFFIINKHTIGISDNVLIVILGTTTANVLGLPFIILKGLFSKKSKNKSLI